MTPRTPLAGLCDYLVWLGNEPAGTWEEQARNALRFLLGLFMSGPLPADEMTPAVPAALASALSHLALVWGEVPLKRIGAAELADAAAVSGSYLNRLFQSEFGISVARGSKACASHASRLS